MPRGDYLDPWSWIFTQHKGSVACRRTKRKWDYRPYGLWNAMPAASSAAVIAEQQKLYGAYFSRTCASILPKLM
jgi:hypothetical protein